MEIHDYRKKEGVRTSEFLARNFLFSYFENRLDAERKAAVEVFLKENSEARHELENIKKADQYLKELSSLSIENDYLTELIARKSNLDKFLDLVRFETWPAGLKMSLEILIVSLGVLSISLVIPWQKLNQINFYTRHEVTLAELDKKQPSPSEIESGVQLEDETQKFPDSNLENPAEKNKTEEKVELGSVGGASKPSQSTGKAVGSLVSNDINQNQNNEVDASTKTQEMQSGKRQGYLYRGVLKVTNVSATSQKFIDKILELGGRKAGEVQLGWKKGNGSYFHFTMPETKYQQFIEFTKDYGQLKINREKHERVMPDGIMRVIFTMEEKK